MGPMLHAGGRYTPHTAGMRLLELANEIRHGLALGDELKAQDLPCGTSIEQP